jgi:acyl carrier protein
MTFETLKELLQSKPFCVREEVFPETRFKDLGDWDSLKHLTLILQVEKLTGTEFAPERIQQLEKLGDLVS